MAAGNQNWGTGVFDIMADDKVCLQTCCCGFCTVSSMINTHEKGMPKLDPMWCCGLCIADYFFRGMATASLLYGIRRELIVKYGIQGEDMCHTCLWQVCCGACGACQLQREMEARGTPCGGLIKGDPPAAQAAMGVAAPLVGAAASKLAGMLPGQQSGQLPAKWNSELFQCSLHECLDGWCCGPCAIGMMSNKIDAGRTPELPPGGENKIHMPACVGACCGGVPMVVGNRREIIQRYGLQGEDFLRTMMVSLCCGPCAFCQQRREMGYRGEWPGGMIAKDAPALPSQ